MLLNQSCPCGNSLPYGDCCGHYHSGRAIAPTAEALMRSRFSAFVKGQVDYLLETLHPSKRKPGEKLKLAQSIRQTHWVSLKVLASKQGKGKDKKGIVEFMAVYDRPQVGQMHERSRFVQEQGRWFYVDGDMLPPYQPKRHEPCWCNSGKKFKQCHGLK